MRVTPTSMPASKSDIRKLMRERRLELSARDRANASLHLCHRLKHHPFFEKAWTVGLYFPNDGEIAVTSLAAKPHSKRFYLPILPPPGLRRLWFGAYEPGAHMYTDRFGIPEPLTRVRARAEALDLIVVPLVAFDSTGGRIGMGGGFYDASLSFLQRFPRIRPLRVVGAAYHFQQIDTIPKNDWDVPLHGVITDQQFISAS